MINNIILHCVISITITITEENLLLLLHYYYLLLDFNENHCGGDPELTIYSVGFVYTGVRGAYSVNTG